MIRELAREVTEILRQRSIPIEVFADEPVGAASTTFARERAVLEHAEGPGADRFEPVRSQRSRDSHYFTRTVGYTLTIYAKSPKEGALSWEHKRRANDFLDQILIAFSDVAATRRNEFAPLGGGFVPSDDLEGSEHPGGARYVLALTFTRAVIPRTWKGELAPTATFGDGTNPSDVTIGSVTRVSYAEANTDTSAPPVGADTNCGA